MTDEGYGEEESSVGANAVIDDDVDEDMLKNDIDDDDDIVNPFNTIFESNGDRNVELDEEEDTEEG